MNKISTLFTKHFRNLHFVSVILLAIVIFIGDTTINPYINQVITVVFYSPFSKLKNSFADYYAVSEDNHRLSQTLIDATMKISLLEEAGKENDRLRAMLGFEPPEDYTMIPVEIVSVSGTYIPVSAIINKGEEDSVWLDQPVINQQGLIGRISSVSQDYAVVQLLTDPSNRVAARVVESREMGIIKYHTQTGMVLDNFPTQGTINVGNEVISSGLGGVYPAGLKVGTVEDIKIVELDPFYTIKITPAANFYSLEELFILRENKTE